jgi:hypothetical protein
MNNIKYVLVILAVSMAVFLINGCKKEDNPAAPPPTVEHPPATTVTMILVRLDGSGNPTTDTTKCTVRDTSLVHGKFFLEGSLNLISGNAYKGTFILLDESQTPAENLNADIISEKDAHVFKFSCTGGFDTARVKISNQDLDSHGLVFGLNFKVTVTAGSPVNGNIHVILEHHDDGNKSGTEFDLDLDRDFPVVIN